MDQHPIPVIAIQTEADLINLIGKMKITLVRGQHPIPVMEIQTAVDFPKLKYQTY